MAVEAATTQESKRSSTEGIRFAVSQHGNTGDVIVVTVNNGNPSDKLSPAFSDGARTVIYGKKNTPRDATFHENIENMGWFVPPFKTVPHRRGDINDDVSIKTVSNDKEWPVFAFVFVYVKKNDRSPSTMDQVPGLIQELIEGMKRYDTIAANRKKSNSVAYLNTYHEFNKQSDLLYDLKGETYTPLDHVLTDTYVSELLVMSKGEMNLKKHTKNFFLFIHAEEEKDMFSVKQNGYNYIPIVEHGYPVCEDTPITTIIDRLKETNDILQNEHKPEEVVSILERVSEAVLVKMDKTKVTDTLIDLVKKLHDKTTTIHTSDGENIQDIFAGILRDFGIEQDLTPDMSVSNKKIKPNTLFETT